MSPWDCFLWSNYPGTSFKEPGVGSTHQDKFIFYETWPSLCLVFVPARCISLNILISGCRSPDLAHCNNQIISIADKQTWAVHSSLTKAITMTFTNSLTNTAAFCSQQQLQCRVVVKRVHSIPVTTIIAEMADQSLQRPKIPIFC